LLAKDNIGVLSNRNVAHGLALPVQDGMPFSSYNTRVRSVKSGLRIERVADVIVGKLRKGVGGYNTKSQCGTGEEELTTENCQLCPNQRRPAPKPNNREFVDKVLKRQNDKAKEEARREQGRIEEDHKQNLGKVRVTFAEVIIGALETQIHFFLCLGARSQDMLLEICEIIGQSKQGTEPYVVQKNGESGWE